MAFEKKFNKALIGLVIGTTIAGIVGSKTPAGKKVVKKSAQSISGGAKKIIEFLQGGLEEMKKKLDEKDQNTTSDEEQ